MKRAEWVGVIGSCRLAGLVKGGRWVGPVPAVAQQRLSVDKELNPNFHL